MSKPYVICFAGVPGSSKSVVAYSLSSTFSLSIYSTDDIRFEVKEDMLVSNINDPKALKEFKHRDKQRFQEMFDKKTSFIRDGSVDRHWAEIKEQLGSAGYEWFLIDMELSKEFLVNLYSKTDRPHAIEELDAYLAQHLDFMKQYSSDVNLKITDEEFKDRNSMAEKSVRKFLDKISQ